MVYIEEVTKSKAGARAIRGDMVECVGVGR